MNKYVIIKKENKTNYDLLNEISIYICLNMNNILLVLITFNFQNWLKKIPKQRQSRINCNNYLFYSLGHRSNFESQINKLLYKIINYLWNL